MKIVHIIWALEVGGSESMLVDILNEQSKAQDVHLLIVNQLENDSLIGKINDNVQIHRIKRKPGSRNILNLILCNIKIIKLCPDVIHSHNHDLVQFIPIVRLTARKLFLTIHNTGISTRHFSKYNRLFAISKTVQKDVYDRINLMPVTICNGIKTDLIKKKTDYSFDSFRMIQIGRLYHGHKGQDITLHSISYLVHSLNIKNFSIEFIGSGDSEPYLRDLTTRLKINDYCNFIGLKQRAWIYDHLCEYDLLLQPSRYEGFGLTVVEAMAAKVPVLVSDIEGPMEIIDSGTFGYYFKSEDSINCADTILEIMKNYQNVDMQSKVNKGLKHIKNMYSIQNTAKEYIKNYN